MKILDGSLESVPGFKFSAVKAGIKYKDRLDYCIIVSDTLCNASGVFTTNKICAAPVKICRERIGNPVKAILINATNANACTGAAGHANAVKLTSDIASRLNARPDSILMSSTGVIGRQLPADIMMKSHEEMTEALTRDQGKIIPRAIMTTDTYPKSAAVSFETTKGEFYLAGTAKGSGMIAPNMATLLCYIITSAPLRKDMLDTIFKKAIDKTLNSLTIDGDMSTNDTAIILSPIAEGPLTDPGDLKNFEEALTHVLQKLSEMLIHDAEGATKLVKVHVKGAMNSDEAKKAARAISESLLVKTAFFGMDPNWGRIAAAAGYSGAEIIEERLSIAFEKIDLLINGSPVEYDNEELKKILYRREFSVMVDLGLGNGEAMMMTSDISYDYVKINAEYTT